MAKTKSISDIKFQFTNISAYLCKRYLGEDYSMVAPDERDRRMSAANKAISKLRKVCERYLFNCMTSKEVLYATRELRDKMKHTRTCSVEFIELERRIYSDMEFIQVPTSIYMAPRKKST